MSLISESGMAIEDKLGWEIKNKDIKKLNEERIKLNRLVSRYYELIEDICPNKETVRKILRRIKEIKYQGKKIKPDNNFDNLVYDDIMSTANAVETWIKYFEGPTLRNGKRLTVSNLLSAIFIENTYTTLVDMLKEYNHTLMDEYDDIMSTFYVTTLDTRRKEIQEKYLNMAISEAAKPTKKFLKDHNFLEPDFKIDVDTSPKSFSFFNEESNELLLAPDEIFITINEKGEKVIFKGLWIDNYVHEYAHVLQYVYSKKFMPEGMWYSVKEISPVVHGIALEGAPIIMESLLIDWIKKNKKLFEISEAELKAAEMYPEAYLNEKVIEVCYDIFNIREKNERNFDALKTLTDQLGMHIFERDERLLQPRSLHQETFMELQYLIGAHFVKTRILDRLNVEYGNGFTKRNRDLIAKGLLLGSFRPKVMERFFFEEYVPRVLEFIH